MRRIESLDSLRGLAAMVVVFHHCALVVPGVHEAIAATYILRPLIAGPSAVFVFFVLSGFVLYLTFEQKDGFRYPPYLIKRIARICLPLAAAVLISTVLYLIIRPQPIIGLSEWFNRLSWSEFPTVKLIIGHILPLDPWRYLTLDNVIWSLVHEVRISILFPLLALAIRWQTWCALIGALIIATLCALPVAQTGGFILSQLASTLQYVFLFAAGAAMARHQQSVRDWLARDAARRAMPVLLLIAVTMLCVSGEGVALQWVIGLGGILLVALCFASPKVETVLGAPTLVWLGRVSYSLYLLHLLVLLTLLHALAGKAPVWLLIAAVPPLALVAAELGYRFIERPSIALGRQVAAALSFPDRTRLRRHG